MYNTYKQKELTTLNETVKLLSKAISNIERLKLKWLDTEEIVPKSKSRESLYVEIIDKVNILKKQIKEIPIYMAEEYIERDGITLLKQEIITKLDTDYKQEEWDIENE